MWMVVAVLNGVEVTDEQNISRLEGIEDRLVAAAAGGWTLRFVVALGPFLIHYLSK